MKTQSWWLILVEGIVALALGMYLLVAPSQAWFYVGALAAVFLLVSGLIDFFGNLFSRLVLRSRARRFRGLVGIFFGGILLLLAWIRPAWMSLATAYLILGLGLIAYGGLGIWVSLFARRGRPMRWVSILLNGLLLLWGLAVFFDRNSEVNLKTLSVLVLLVVGAVMVVWAFITRSRGGEEDAEPAAGAAPEASSALPVTTAPAASPTPAAVAVVATTTSEAVTNVTPVAAAAEAAVSSEPAADAAQQASTEAVTDIAPVAAAAAAEIASDPAVDTELTSGSELKPTNSPL